MIPQTNPWARPVQSLILVRAYKEFLKSCLEDKEKLKSLLRLFSRCFPYWPGLAFEWQAFELELVLAQASVNMVLALSGQLSNYVYFVFYFCALKVWHKIIQVFFQKLRPNRWQNAHMKPTSWSQNLALKKFFNGFWSRPWLRLVMLSFWRDLDMTLRIVPVNFISASNDCINQLKFMPI